MVAYGVTDLFGCSGQLADFWELSFSGHPTLASIWAIDPLLIGTSQLVEVLCVVACGVFTIRSPGCVLRACCLAFFATIIHSSFSVRATFQFVPDIPERIAIISGQFLEPFIALALLVCLLRARSGLHFEGDIRLCPTCGYDLRGITSLTCTECGRCFAPLEYYNLVDHCSSLLARSFGVALLAFGIGEVASRFELIVGAFRLGVGVPFTGNVTPLDKIEVIPSLSAGIGQLVEGAIELFCGVAMMRSPRLMVRACCVAVAVAALQSSIEYQSTLSSLGRDYPDIPRRIVWFASSFRAPIVGLAILAAIYPMRHMLGTLGLQRPVCQYCGAHMSEPQALCCIQCGRRYSPSEFAQLELAG
jgi:hypothetical protein